MLTTAGFFNFLLWESIQYYSDRIQTKNVELTVIIHSVLINTILDQSSELLKW